MKNLCLPIFVLGSYVCACAQIHLQTYHPFNIVNEQRQILKRMQVSQAIFHNTTTRKIENTAKTKPKITEKKFYDDEGRDTLIYEDDVTSRRIIYDSLSSMKIEFSYDTEGKYSSTDTISVNADMSHKGNEAYKYDTKDRLVLIYEVKDSSQVQKSKKVYPFEAVFAVPLVDSIQYSYNSRNQIIKETFVVKQSQLRETALFSYNSKGLIRKIKYGDFISLIKYIYR
jgi:hypothetical protein